jgi:hypothetical protein
MPQSTKKLGKETLYSLYAGLICGAGGIAALDNHLTALAIVLFALFFLGLITTLVASLLFASRSNAEVDRIVREAKAQNGQGAYKSELK